MATAITGDDGSYTFSSVPPDTTYWVRLNGPNDDFIGWIAGDLTVTDQDVQRGIQYLPKTISLSSPSYGATVTNLNPTLTWEANPDAANYKVQLNVTDSLESVELEWTNSAVPTYTVTTQLTPGVKYTWQIEAVDAADLYVGTTPQSFTFTVAP